MKAAIKSVEMAGIAVNVPVGSMDTPTQFGETIVKLIQNAKNWKLPTEKFVTADKSKAEDVGYTLNWYMGGHEIETRYNNGVTEYVVSSKGYYHYIGA